MTVAAQTQDDAIRVMIVDDSAVIRHVIARIFAPLSQFAVVATAGNGQRAIDVLKSTPADVIILDIEMPLMDGLTALPGLKAVDPGVQIVMASTLTSKNAEISFRALNAGATDCIPKPSGVTAQFPEDFSRELVQKVTALGALARRKGVRRAKGAAPAPTPLRAPQPQEHAEKKFTLRRFTMIKPHIIALCASTGGPEALMRVIREMGKNLLQPVVITQHMPPTFTSILAANISRQCEVQCVEATDGMPVEAGKYYVAPGDYHMLVADEPQGKVIRLSQTPRENFCRPAADPMLRSLAAVYGKNILTVVLTGMGQDGMKGCETVVQAGGNVIAQDEATSIVWGMPGAAAMAGLCAAVLPLPQIGAAVRRVASGEGL